MEISRAPKASRAATARRAVVEVLVNLAAPYAIYAYADKPFGDVRALLASSAPPLCWSIAGFVRNRRVDAVSLLVLVGIVLSLLAFVGGGSVKVLQLRENLVTGLIGLVFLGSVLVRKPLMYQLARASMARQSPEKLREFESLRDREGFRRAMRFMTIVWGVGLLAQTAVACALVFTLSIRRYLVAGPIVGYAGFGALVLWNVWYVRRQRAKHEDA